ncbi:hypothetical protein DSM110093_02615 [Sulfitobacter sp. DSM 110093]|nr:hypothetical protein DSM110093_02615 [Sulfitobacter sp. DSM 110093]
MCHWDYPGKARGAVTRQSGDLPTDMKPRPDGVYRGGKLDVAALAIFRFASCP